MEERKQLQVLQKYEVNLVLYLTHTYPLGGHFNKDARQPIYPSCSDELLKGTILQRTFKLINEICVSFGFEIGDKVLLEDAKKRTLGGKVILASFNLSSLKRYYGWKGAEGEDKETSVS
ncbi:25515_t:CDS:2 [Gigaspora rosea]|nr:25515_t:CDS:2 [Gigaspora rosea]